MEWNTVFMVWLLIKHALQTWVHCGTLVTPALTFEYADRECDGNTVVTVKDFISLMVTMMAADGQVRWGYYGCVLVTSCLVSFSVTVLIVFVLIVFVFIVFNVFIVFLVMSSFGPYVFVSSHVLSDLWSIKPFKQLRVRSLWPPATVTNILPARGHPARD